MLVLTRKANEQILIGDDIKITLVRIRGNSVRVGIEAPREVRVVRGELAARDIEHEVELEFELEERETAFAHPQERIGRHNKEVSGNRLAATLTQPADSLEDQPRIFVGRVRRADMEGAKLHRAPLAGFVSAT